MSITQWIGLGLIAFGLAVLYGLYRSHEDQRKHDRWVQARRRAMLNDAEREEYDSLAVSAVFGAVTPASVARIDELEMVADYRLAKMQEEDRWS